MKNLINDKTNNERSFSFFSSPISNTKPSRDFTLLDAYNYIVGHQASHSTNSLRAIKDKSYARKYKANNFNYCTFSGTFTKRDDKAIIQHSGLLCLDFDHLDNIEEVKKTLLLDEYFETQLLFISPSGDGLKWVIEIDISKASHQDWFDSISNYLMQTHSLEADPQCRNISRACLNAHGHGITSKTIFHLAKQAGITITHISPITPIIPTKTSITSTEVFEVLEENESLSSNQMPTFSDKVKDYLPDFLKKVVGNAISDEDADLLILGTLTAVSACLPNIYGIYSGREVFPNLFLFVTAQASAGKGRLSLCRHIVEPIHRQLREQYAAEMEQYRRLQVEYAMNKKDPEAEAPQEPPLKTLFIPANSSATAVYQVLNANKGIGLIFETEGDTLANTFRSDFGNFSDGFRKAFHHETISYNRRKDKEFVELEKPRMSALLSGTPRQILSLIPDTENGLFSRFLFYCLNIRIVWNDVFAVQDETLDTHFENYGREFYDLYRLLKTSNPIRFALTASQQAEFHSFFKQIQDEYSSVFGLDFVASVRRLGLITFRLAMIISSLRILENGQFPNVMLCDDNDFHTAKTMVGILLKHTAKVYQTIPAIDDETLKNSKNQAKNNYYQSLPPDFDKQTALNVAQTMSIPKTTAERYLKQWCLSAQLNHVKHGMYSKP